MIQLVDYLNKFIDRRDLLSLSDGDYNSEVIRRIHRQASMHQGTKITMTDLDSHLYRSGEQLVMKLTNEAKCGRKDVMTWSIILSSINQLQETTSCILSNISSCHLYLTSSEKQDMEMNSNHLAQLSSILFESISRVICLDADYISILEKTSVLLINSMYLLQRSVDAELFLWNPIPKYICNQRALKNYNEVVRLAKSFAHQISSLAEIISTCPPSNEKLQSEFDKLFSTCQSFTSWSLENHEYSKSIFEGHEETWHVVVRRMFMFIHAAIKSLTSVTGSFLIGQTYPFHDMSKLQEIVNSLADDMRETAQNVMDHLECVHEEANLHEEQHNKVSENWIYRLKSMRHLLTRKVDGYISCVSSSSLKKHDNDPDKSNVYHFEADCLLLLMIFCRAQINKSEKFMTRKTYDPSDIPTNYIAKKSLNLSVADNDKGDDENKLINIIQIIKECSEQQSKEAPLSMKWVEQLNGKRMLLDEKISFLSSCASNKGSGSSMRASMQLVSSLVFQIDALSRFDAFSGHDKFDQIHTSATIENLSQALKGLHTDVMDTASEGFEKSSNISRKERQLLDEMLEWKNCFKKRLEIH